MNPQDESQAASAPLNTPISVNIRSEFDLLRTVIVHEPSHEVDRLTPLNKERLLFEDIPYLPQMQKEHRDFVTLLRANGVRVLMLGELLLDILQNEDSRREVVTHACAASSVLSLGDLILDSYSAEELRDVLLSGLTANEIFEKTGKRLRPPDFKEDPFLLDPIPNAYFSRDPAAAVADCVVSSKMHFLARIRESIIVREIFRKHPLLSHNHIIYGNCGEEERPFTIEGGDIIILTSKAIAIGCSERTRGESIRLLAEKLFRLGRVQRVYEISIPSRRVYMHLDTVFTIVDTGVVVAYPDVMSEIKAIRRYEPYMIPKGEIIAFPVDDSRSFNRILEEEFGGLKVIHTGNNNHRYAAREQQADGTNVFALAPSTVITYNRNTHTNQALKDAGIKVLEIEGSELVRGLGGPRCMTMPIERVHASVLDASH